MCDTETVFRRWKLQRAVFNWLSNAITWLRLLRLVIGLEDSRQFFNQWEAKPKQTAPCTHDFSRAKSELQVIARNCDWFIALFAPVVIGRSNCFGFGFSTVIWKPLYSSQSLLLSLRLAGSSTHKSVWNVNLSGLRTKLQNNLDPPSTTKSPETYTRSRKRNALGFCTYAAGNSGIQIYFTANSLRYEVGQKVCLAGVKLKR